MVDAYGTWLEGRGLMGSLAIHRGEWWRLITATTLHADIGHLASNLGSGLLLMGVAMARYGAGYALLATLLAGVTGNLMGYLLRTQPYHGLGASGVVMGALGLLAIQSLGHLRRHPSSKRQILSGFVGGAFLFVLLGLNPAADVLAHTGGFLAGLALGVLGNLLPARITKALWFNWMGVVTSALLIGLAWILALVTHG